MTNELWNDELNFIEGKVPDQYSYSKNEMNNNFSLVVIVGERKYDPLMYLDLLLSSFASKIDQSKDLAKRIEFAYEAKSAIIHQIQAYKQELEDATINVKTYDFSGKISQIDSIIEMIKLELDVKKYELEIDKLQFEKKSLVRYLPYIVSVLAILLTGISIILNYRTSLRH